MNHVKSQKKVFFVVGPTAAGKSSIAMAMAQKCNGEIISSDAMQVYREVSIASNKPSIEMLQEVPHHLIDILSVEQEYNVAQFNQLACHMIDEIHARRRIPLVVGGSGLYTQVLLDGIFEDDSYDEAFRQQLIQVAQVEGGAVLHTRLQKVDKILADKIHANDIKRIIRALEVCHASPLLMSEKQKQRRGIWEEYNIKVFVVNREREELYQCIDTRVDAMVAQGLVDEIQALETKTLSRTAQTIIGVREIQQYLLGALSLDKAVDLMKRNSRRYAKRQLTWFRRDQRFQWVTFQQEKDKQDFIKRFENDLKEEV